MILTLLLDSMFGGSQNLCICYHFPILNKLVSFVPYFPAHPNNHFLIFLHSESDSTPPTNLKD